jgi:hypothetical protein
MTGTGGRSMESLIDAGFIRGLLDTTPTELCDELLAGDAPALDDEGEPEPESPLDFFSEPPAFSEPPDFSAPPDFSGVDPAEAPPPLAPAASRLSVR